MKIYKYEVPDALIMKYCRIITALEKKYLSELEYAKAQLHQEILDSVGVGRAGVFKDERLFMKVLNETIIDLTFVDTEINTMVLNKPFKKFVWRLYRH
jgi:hypothetical protein